MAVNGDGLMHRGREYGKSICPMPTRLPCRQATSALASPRQQRMHNDRAAGGIFSRRGNDRAVCLILEGFEAYDVRIVSDGGADELCRDRWHDP